MVDKGKVPVLGVMVDGVDYEAAVARIIEAAGKGVGYSVSALAVHGVMTGADDEEHMARLNQLDLVVPDGQPVRWAMNWLFGLKLSDRVYGPKLMLEVCKAATENGLSIYLYGSTRETLDLLHARLPKLVPGIQIAGMQPSRFRRATERELDQIAAEIKGTGASICMVGLGCPRQEVFVFENAERMSMPILAVGAAFDFHAGLQTQPPEWVQRAGLQWLQRLIRNPRRLWRRYLLLNPRFIVGIARQASGVRSSIKPAQPMKIGHS